MKWQEWSEVAKDETLWQNHAESGLLKAKYVRDYVLQLWFEETLDVSIYELDFYELLINDDLGPAFLPLRDKDRFQQAKGDYSLVWLNPETGAYDEQAIDIAPECVRFFCQRYGKSLKMIL
ncbi:hypothetical protein QUF64_11325 [Anaerolineales bacterium HSG6]|nr:hypothetical protein [Anaerolineales bacterium HSG6]MDM8531747.1 hypothetical protein [Anaerolineales bacterium HSG25]